MRQRIVGWNRMSKAERVAASPRWAALFGHEPAGDRRKALYRYPGWRRMTGRERLATSTRWGQRGSGTGWVAVQARWLERAVCEWCAVREAEILEAEGLAPRYRDEPVSWPYYYL